MEFALIVLPLVTLLFAIIEGGYLLRTHLSFGAAVEDSVRRASVVGDDPKADYYILQALGEDLELAPEDVRRIVIFKPSNPRQGPPSSCVAGTPSAVCNVYSGADLERDAGTFGIGGIDSHWDPTSRSIDLDNPDLIGIYVEVRHNMLTHFFGAGFDLRQVAVLPLERGTS